MKRGGWLIAGLAGWAWCAPGWPASAAPDSDPGPLIAVAPMEAAAEAAVEAADPAAPLPPLGEPDHAEPAAPDDDDPVEPEPMMVDAKVSSVSMSGHLNVDEQGNVNHRSFNLNASGWIELPADTDVIGWRNVTVTRVLTPLGRDLAIDPDKHSRRNTSSQRMQVRPNGMVGLNFNLRLPTPPMGTQSLLSVEGEVELMVPTGPLHHITLKPFSDFAGKWVRIVEINGSRLKVERKQQGQYVEVRYPKSLGDLVKDVKMVNADGAQIEVDTSGWGSSGEVMYRNYRAPLLDDGGVVVELYTEVKTIPARFVIRDLPLPAAEPNAAQPMMAVHAVPVDAAGAVGAGDELELELIDGDDADAQ